MYLTHEYTNTSHQITSHRNTALLYSALLYSLEFAPLTLVIDADKDGLSMATDLVQSIGRLLTLNGLWIPFVQFVQGQMLDLLGHLRGVLFA